MAEDRHFWVLDDRVLKYVRFNEFHWTELLTIAVSLGLLASYALLALYLDRRARARRRRQKQLARLERWLDAWELEPAELEALQDLADGPAPLDLYTLLADPYRFEAAVHQAAQAGERLAFADRIREALGYQSSHAGVPIASTRQLMAGDHLRFQVWEEGRPQHHFGQVAAVSAAGVTVELTEIGFRAVTASKGETELFFLRSNDVEYRFPFLLRSAEAARNRLLIAHQLVRGGHRARSIRLPMMRPIVFRLHTQLGGTADSDDAADGAPQAHAEPAPAGEEVRAALLEMSEGGLSMVLMRPVAEGAYVEYAMPMPRGRTLPIMARVLDCRPFGGNRWLARCELRGLTPSQRSVLSQLLRLELQRRLRAAQDERRKRRKALEDSTR